MVRPLARTASRRRRLNSEQRLAGERNLHSDHRGKRRRFTSCSLRTEAAAGSSHAFLRTGTRLLLAFKTRPKSLQTFGGHRASPPSNLMCWTPVWLPQQLSALMRSITSSTVSTPTTSSKRTGNRLRSSRKPARLPTYAVSCISQGWCPRINRVANITLAGNYTQD